MIELTIKSTFLTAQKHSDTLKRFQWRTLPMAGLRHVLDLVEDGTLDNELSDGQRAEAARVSAKLGAVLTAPNWPDPLDYQYLVFKDGSLLVRDCAPEVWADACDFYNDRLAPIMLDGLPLDPQDWALLRHIGARDLPVQVRVIGCFTGATRGEVTLDGPVTFTRCEAGEVLSIRQLAYLGLDAEDVIDVELADVRNEVTP